MEKANVIVRAVVGQVYSRLVLAATQNIHLFFNDLSPAIYGVQFCRLRSEQADVVWDILYETMKIDAAANRLPLAALYLSRKGGEKVPGAGFWSAYRTLYGTEISEDDWSDLVKQIWKSYSMQDDNHEKETQ